MKKFRNAGSLSRFVLPAAFGPKTPASTVVLSPQIESANESSVGVLALVVSANSPESRKEQKFSNFRWRIISWASYASDLKNPSKMQKFLQFCADFGFRP